MHWNHENLPHWDARVNERYPHFRHDPDLGDVGSTFYPRLGAYSSRDAVVIEDHMKQLVKARAGTLVLSWFAPGRADPRTENVDTLVLPLLDAARTHGLELCLHLEPYEGRSAASARADVDYAVRRYGRHPAYHKSAAQGGQPVFYAYDSYQIPADEWAKSFPTNVGDKNWYVVGLVLHEGHLDEYVIRGPFDAGYSYFGAEGFTQAASPSRWRRFVEEAREAGKAFVPCVAPGYDDLRVRPWNGANSRPRNAGAYYDTMWTAAVESGARVVGVTSFNEWHEGTQIEASVPFSSSRDGVPPYEDYGSLGPEFYLDRTRHWVANFEQRAGL
ncbi:hypothetical protein CTAYLR_009314 [Chrysophaeum taylorii]|uniref:Uncharacterized protein n=1 Tax=Chrysophaeum taylorii TaxID=2483200 RepID=A0AAD7XR62_9STRA|nr:hypothetical protein CTAYLR_009314 [Chrysophaeum taylorii]